MKTMDAHTIGRKGVLRRTKKGFISQEVKVNDRLYTIQRKKDFFCLEHVNNQLVNILEGLELHTNVFNNREQERVIKFIYDLQRKGQNQELQGRTYCEPPKWMRGKGRVTIQFGCCYNYAVDKEGNPPGIVQYEQVDEIPSLFKLIIKRLVQWHVLPNTCIPDSCIVNIYDAEDCIPPHIDHHDFVRPFCTLSLLSECNIVFGSKLDVMGPGEFEGSFSLPLPLGSVLVFNGNAADVAKHAIPAVSSKRFEVLLSQRKLVVHLQLFQILGTLSAFLFCFMNRISITFRKMDPSKTPYGFSPNFYLLDTQPICPVMN